MAVDETQVSCVVEAGCVANNYLEGVYNRGAVACHMVSMAEA